MSASQRLTTFCVNLDVELATLVRVRIEQEGLKVAELLRLLLQQWLEGGVPTVDDGYRQAKMIANDLVRVLLVKAYHELPETYEEAIHLVTNLRAQQRGVEPL